jgi:hypothetical protein
MKPSATRDQEAAAYDAGLFEDLTVQDAITIVALFVLRLASDVSGKGLRRVEAVLQRQPLFEESSEHTRERLQKFSNAFRSVDPQEAVEHAAAVLSIAGAEKKARAIAAEVAKFAAATSEENKAVMKNVSSVLDGAE